MAIELENISKSFGQKMVIDKLCLSIPEGSVCAFLGKNGSGKSTTLRILGGSLKADSGTCSKPLPCLSVLDFDRYFHFKLTGYENIRYYLALLKQERISKSKLNGLLTLYGLEDISSKLFGTYSKGQKIRLSMLLMDAAPWKCMLLDEPTNGLDIDGVQLLRKLFVKFRSASASIIFSTHDEEFMKSIADTAALFEENNVVTLMQPGDTATKTLYSVQVFDNDILQEHEWDEINLLRFIESGKGSQIRSIDIHSSNWRLK